MSILARTWAARVPPYRRPRPGRAAGPRPDEPFHREVHYEYRVSRGWLGQQPPSERVEPDGCRGQREGDAVDLLEVVAVDRRQAGLSAPGDVDAMARRREHQRARMI